MVHHEESQIDKRKNDEVNRNSINTVLVGFLTNSDITSSCFSREKIMKDVTSILARNMGYFFNSIPACNGKVSDDTDLDTETIW